jgi:hypothetical protein
MKSLFIIIISVLFYSCMHKSYVLNKEDLEGRKLYCQGNVHKVNIEVDAMSNCKSQISIRLNDFVYNVPITGTVDTVLTSDWYKSTAYVKVDYDSCIINHPNIKITFYRI